MGAPQDGTDARQELPRTEGLGQVIVRPQLQPHDPIGFFSAPGEDDDGNLRVRAHLPQQLHAVFALQPQVEQHEVDHLSAECAHELSARGGARDTEIVLQQIVVDQPAHRRIVIDDQHMRPRQAAHRGSHS